MTSTAAPSGVPTFIPQVISNPNTTVAKPEDSTLVQLGFQYALNYIFVVQNPKAAAQIFQFLPLGLANGLALDPSEVFMQSLLPLDTTSELGFITTIALAYIPSSMYNTLALELHLPQSALYTNDDTSVNTLMNYLNVAVPLTPGSTLGNSATGTGSGASATSSTASGNNNAVFNTPNQNTSAKTTGTTAAIVAGGVGAAAAYGAAMFLIARRYKKRKLSHRRSSSVLNPAEMRQSGSPALLGGAGAFMSGGRTTPGHDRNSRGSGRTGNSARTQQISAPMMAENSLGWN
jgi:hypothetical protein